MVKVPPDSFSMYGSPAGTAVVYEQTKYTQARSYFKEKLETKSI